MSSASRPTAKRASPTRTNNRGGTLLGLFVGLALGLLIALGVAWYLRQAPLPFENKFQPAPAKPANGSTTAEPKALPLPGKTTDADAKQRFDFYGILEGKQTAAPPTDAKPTTPAPLPGAGHPNTTVPAAASGDTSAASKEMLYLQVGAFQKAADADNIRAKLSLMGFDASISEAEVPDKGTMYRVRTGPYASAAEMNKARTELANNGIQSSLVKIK